MNGRSGVVPRETRRDRLTLARRAGLGRVSAWGALTGVLVAYAAFTVLVGLATAVLAVVGLDVDLTEREWRQVGAAAGIGTGVLLFLAYLLGGYVGGRMARRAGLVNGLAVFAGGLVVAGVTVGIVEATGETGAALERLRDNLRSFGAPTSASQWGAAGTVAGVAALVGMFLGAVVGGELGERWHARLAGAAEPAVDPEPELERIAVLEARLAALQGQVEALAEPPEEVNLVDLTKEELYHRAQEAGIEGRSQMTKEQLIDALQNRTAADQASSPT